MAQTQPHVPTKPPKLKPRHFTVAAMHAANYTNKEIGQKLQMSTHAVGIALRSPLVQLEVQRLTRQQNERITNDFTDRVLQDGDRNVTFLKKMRDGKLDDMAFLEPAERLNLRLKAALPLFDRQMPKQKEGQSNPTVNITLQRNEQIVMAESCRAVGVRIPQIDTVIDDMKQAELDAIETE